VEIIWAFECLLPAAAKRRVHAVALFAAEGFPARRPPTSPSHLLSVPWVWALLADGWTLRGASGDVDKSARPTVKDETR